jgi:hypothetical protein
MLKNFKPEELLTLRDMLRVDVVDEDANAAVAEGLPNPRIAMARFVKAH